MYRKLYGQAGQGNLTVRKIYGKHDKIRYLRCCECQEEFSERKNTALWNCKIPEGKALSVVEHLSEANSIKRTARLVRVDPSTVRRLNKRSVMPAMRPRFQRYLGDLITLLEKEIWGEFPISNIVFLQRRSCSGHQTPSG